MSTSCSPVGIPRAGGKSEMAGWILAGLMVLVVAAVPVAAVLGIALAVVAIRVFNS